MAGHGADAGSCREALGFELVAHRVDGARVRPDEGNAGLRQRRREGGALRQEAVAGVDGLGAGPAAGLHDAVDVEVGLRRGGRPDGDCLVGHGNVQRVAVGLGIDRHGGDAHALGGLDDATGDLAPVRDEDL